MLFPESGRALSEQLTHSQWKYKQVREALVEQLGVLETVQFMSAIKLTELFNDSQLQIFFSSSNLGLNSIDSLSKVYRFIVPVFPVSDYKVGRKKCSSVKYSVVSESKIVICLTDVSASQLVLICAVSKCRAEFARSYISKIRSICVSLMIDLASGADCRCVTYEAQRVAEGNGYLDEEVVEKVKIAYYVSNRVLIRFYLRSLLSNTQMITSKEMYYHSLRVPGEVEPFGSCRSQIVVSRQQNGERHQKLNGTTFAGALVGTTIFGAGIQDDHKVKVNHPP
ncbi:hypothetical protein Tco_0955285 [Tanacetum coccineum]|uniref:Uncharacterized protein n=1 Tax=Tanacetum coccineum TaxID=301880 RepID=A0ABQ5E6R9_9ASTR